MSEVQDDIATLKSLKRTELVEAWIKAFGHPPFKGARKACLVRGLAYDIQCKQLGGLKKITQKKLLQIAKSGGKSMSHEAKSAPKIKLGSQLVREWNGRNHTVHITDQGYVMNGVTYGSLSAVAKAITGAHWSGPRFFGVNR